jgi:hypothetical protein
MREIRESGANVTVKSARHSLKHPLPSVSTEEGMQIDKSDAHSANA